MAKQLQLRGGTTAEHSTFTGANREVTVDTTTNSLRVHDGATVGGNIVGAITVDSVSDLPTSALDGQVCIVKDLNRGGTFIYDSTEVANDNQGTNFNGWIRQYSGAVNVKWFSSIQDALSIGGVIDGGGEEFPVGNLTVDVNNTVLQNIKLLYSGSTVCLSIIADGCSILNCKVYRSTKSTNPSMVYSSSGISLNGDNCSVINSEVYNINGTGISFDGRYSKILSSTVRDNITGIRGGGAARDTVIDNCVIVDNNVNNSSGADGILLSRSCSFVTVSNCFIDNSGEHGVYGQGQNLKFLGNTISNNYGDGLKFGSYDDQINNYDGRLNIWVPGVAGVPGLDGVDGADGFGLQNIIIDGNTLKNNAGGDGIYFQPSCDNVVISNNLLYGDSIRFVYFDYTGIDVRLELHKDIQILGNRLFGGGITVEAYNDVLISGNSVTEYISTGTKETATEPYGGTATGDRFIIKNNSVTNTSLDGYISINRASGHILDSNIIDNLTVVENCNNVKVINNSINYQSSSIDTARINDFSNNTVTCINDLPFNNSAVAFSFPKRFIGNSIIGNSYTSTYFISASFNANMPNNGRFNNNYIECTSSTRAINLEGQWGTFIGNTILSSASTDIAVDCKCDAFNVTGNTIRYGSINLRNDTAGLGSLVVGNKVNSVSGNVVNNIIANNG